MTSERVRVPPIKCQGIKTKLVDWIRENLPGQMQGTYFEPFLGSGVVAFNVRPKRAFLTDSNPHIVAFYEQIKRGQITPLLVSKFLATEGGKLRTYGADYYYEVRDRFNSQKDPLDFLFLSRSCFNGLIRFNRSKSYNVPFGHKPNRFTKSYITKICNQVKWVSLLLRRNEDWTLACMDFREALSRAMATDFVYCDPPYLGRHIDYFNSWSDMEEKQLRETLDQSGAKFTLSTWLKNTYRTNECIDTIWAGFRMVTREHFYHIGAKETNRNSMTEALILNYEHSMSENKPINKVEQLGLFESLIPA
ncbi:Dam family site-specific DNA-(adenine-N6)-methyltransferase [bacterium]|nr:Dam family site-specific DNA-(adenine-N6)-methyltransferase [bacterium]